MGWFHPVFHPHTAFHAGFPTLLLNSQQVTINPEYDCQLHALGRVSPRVPHPLTAPRLLMAAPPCRFLEPQGSCRCHMSPGWTLRARKPGTMGALILALKPLCSCCFLATLPLMHSEGGPRSPQSLWGLCFALFYRKTTRPSLQDSIPGIEPGLLISCIGR